MKVISLILGFLFLFNINSFAAKQKCEYWPNGKMRTCKVFDEKGTIAAVSYYREDGSLEERAQYDEYGHKVQEAHFNSNGKLKETADGWAAMKWEYSGSNMTKESYYGADGKIKERKTFNSSGDLVHKEYFGAGGIDPDEEYNPAVPLLSHETVSYYGSSGEPEGETTMWHD